MARPLSTVCRHQSTVNSYLIMLLVFQNILALPLNRSLPRNTRLTYCHRIVGNGMANELLSLKSSLVFAIKMKGSLCLPTFVNGKNLGRQYERSIALSQVFDVDFLISQLSIAMISCNSSCAKPCAPFNFERMQTLLHNAEHKFGDHCSHSVARESYFVQLNPLVAYFEEFLTDYVTLQTYLRSPAFIRELA